MRKYRLIIQPPAFEDLDAAYQWIRERAPGVAAREALSAEDLAEDL